MKLASELTKAFGQYARRHGYYVRTVRTTTALGWLAIREYEDMKTKTTKRPGQQKDETPFEYLSRVVNGCNYETGGLLDRLKTVDAVLDYFDLWHTYDTDFWQGIIAAISEGDDPEPARAFVTKHKLGKDWREDINIAVKEAREAKQATHA